MKHVLLILDSYEYKLKENSLKKRLGNTNKYTFVYTRYENSITEIFQKMKYLGGGMTHISYWLMSIFYAIRLLIKYNFCKNLIFINPIVGIFYSALCRIFYQTPNITITGFLFEEKKNMVYWKLRKIFVNFCYKKVSHIIVYGESEISYYSSVFPSLASKFKFIEYGRDFHYTNKKEFKYSSTYIASGGRSNRNYQTLCDAFEIIAEKYPDLGCLVATRPECIQESMNRSKVKFIYGITLNQFGSFIENSDLFVLPLKNTNLSAGHMSMMEAMALEKPILVTDIPSIKDYVNESEVFFYNPDNPRDLASQIIHILENRNSKDVTDKIAQSKILYENKYSFAALLERIVNVI